MEINATILVSAISFIVFIFIMNRILYKPVLEIMEKRQNYINSNKAEADKHHKNSQNLLVERDEKLAQAQRESRDIVASKADALKEEKSKVLKDTKDSVTSYFNDQKQSLYREREDVARAMRYDVADLANRLTTRLLGEGVAFEPLKDEEIDEVMRKHV